MKFSTVKIILFLLCSLSIITLKAQQTASGGSISGKLVDATNNEPLELATISIVRKSDNHPVKGMQTDLNGNFAIKGLDDGQYILNATYVSYLPYSSNVITIAPGNRTINLGNIKVAKGKSLLKEVTVTAQKSKIQLGIDKKTFNVDQSLVSQGGSATDLLSNVPSVQVDVDGNLSLRGSTSVRVLIDGKASALTGSSIADVLQSIPASSIESIEVITNPSSKYEAEGQSGIINIILKKNTQKGFTGLASASVGTQNTYNGNFSLAYQNSKINVYANYSYRKGSREGDGFSNKYTNIGDSVNQVQNQISDQSFTYRGQNIRSGISVNLSPNTTLGLTNNINLRSRDRNQNGNTLIYQDGTLINKLDQNSSSSGNGTNLDFSLDFDHKFKKKGEELTANVHYGHDRNHNSEDQFSDIYDYQLPVYNSYVQKNADAGKGHDWDFQTDYTLPLTDGKFEAGYKTSINYDDDDYVVDTLNHVSGIYNYNPFLSNRFIYKENINAAYASYQHQFGDFGIQVGARLEDTHIRTMLMDSVTINHKQDYLRIYPSIFLTQKFSGNQTLQLSYTRRVSRPRGWQISPFIDQSDKLNYQQGNPDLRPEDTHSFELSYIKYWNAVTLTSSLYYRFTNDDIQRVTVPLTSTNVDTTLTTFQNVTSSSHAGYELIAKVSPLKIMDLTANVNVYYRHISGNTSLGLPTTSGYAWNGNLTADLKPIKNLGIQLRGEYQAPQVITQGRMRAMYHIDGGVKYDITKMLSVSGNVRDIFNSRKFRSDINYNSPYFTSNQVSERRWATRSAIITLSYRFGNTSLFKKDKDNKDNRMQQDQDNNSDDNGVLMPPASNNNNGGQQQQPSPKPKGKG
ncbi:MAG TPA: TonB-dependent receptor [Mucilaginibacter sp.]|nr:TonB-dependent receptor [Mucilaginibacter sp.]